MYATARLHASMLLTSSHNPLLQKLRRAVELGRPLETGAIAAEGPHLIAEALGSRWTIEQIFCSTNALERHSNLLSAPALRNIEMTEVSERAFKSVADTEHDQGVIALVRPRSFGWSDVLGSSGPVVILDGIQDPGNAGAIFRSAEAFGASGVALVSGCVRISNGKFLRAAAGSLFRLPFIDNVQHSEVIEQTKVSNRRLYSLAAKARAAITEEHFSQPFALVVGSEGSGVSQELCAASQALSIPTRGVESLNAAVACSVALFEAARQRGFEQ